ELEEIEAAHAGQADVEQNCVRVLAHELLERVLRARDGDHLVAEAGDEVAEDVAQGLLVLDDQHPQATLRRVRGRHLAESRRPIRFSITWVTAEKSSLPHPSATASSYVRFVSSRIGAGTLTARARSRASPASFFISSSANVGVKSPSRTRLARRSKYVPYAIPPPLRTTSSKTDGSTPDWTQTASASATATAVTAPRPLWLSFTPLATPAPPTS